MVGRWHLHRAGILNVYQYGDETIDLAGGRLLLRGVNGSGKSTAMNMLLPFLIDADVRRIDAAGEQTGVLRSWMLSGREEPNPVGYLWIEFARVDGDTGEITYFVCGCGIRASAATDRVTTWWFATDRRPGIDFALLDRRTPISVDTLRSVLGPQAVFSHDKRADYKTEVRARLFGGADLDRHIRLLHTVRSPRVGDRIDVELPAYLVGALPQLSEAALADAAQPLEDLDEHRNNVAALRLTTEALEGMSTVYQSYARSELRARAAHTEDLHREVRTARRTHASASETAATAVSALEAAEATVERLEAEDARFDSELQALRERPAYRDGAELVHLRDHVASLERESQTAHSDSADFGRRRADSARRIAGLARAFTEANVTLHNQLDEIAAIATQSRIDALPPLPSVAALSEIEQEIGEVHIPSSVLNLSPMRSALTRTITDAELRRTDINEVVTILDDVDRFEAKLRLAENQESLRLAQAAEAEAEAETARQTRKDSESTWISTVMAWIEAMKDLETTGISVPFDELSSIVQRADTIDNLADIIRALSDAVELVLDHHSGREAELTSLLLQQLATVKHSRDACGELAKVTLPDPPATRWQRSDRRSVLAELIDFKPNVTPQIQLNIEAAMEASGLLGAELLPSGDVSLVSGELVIHSQQPVESPLSNFVLALEGDTSLTVNAILQSISTNVSEQTGAVIGLDGEFRIGPMRGRHEKSVVEHIGRSNRAAALERKRVEAATVLAEAETAAASTTTAVETCRIHKASAQAHRSALPPSQPLLISVAASDACDRVADRARLEVEQAKRVTASTDAAYAEQTAYGHRISATHQLPFNRERLQDRANELQRLIADCRSTEPRLVALESALRAWLTGVDVWRQSVEDHRERENRARLRAASHGEQRARLITLEDTVGTAWAEVMEIIEATIRDRDQTRETLRTARETSKQASAEKSRADEVARTSMVTVTNQEQRCSASLPTLHKLLEVNGLVAAALATIERSATSDHIIDHIINAPEQGAQPTWPSVNDSADGARELATAIERAIPIPDRTGIGADSVRNSLRQRRENLGAGWDAEDHQPDPSLPLAIIVTGPLGRMPLANASAEVVGQLRQQSSLLTAKQDQALRNLLQGVVANEVAEKLFAAEELVKLMNKRLSTVKTAHGIGTSLRWRRREDVAHDLAELVDLLAKTPDHRDVEENAQLATVLSARIDAARRDDPEATYRDLIAQVLDYRLWYEMTVLVHRPGESPRLLARHPKLSEGEKKVVSYLPLFAAVAASCDALAEQSASAPRFLLLDDAFAKVSEDNHGPLFGLLVELDLDFIATSERLWGTHASVPELSICEVVRDAQMNTIMLEHARWNGRSLERSEGSGESFS
jgi:uncharacterized protein (TIGR02680 family)